MFVTTAKLTEYKATYTEYGMPMILIPDIVVEIVSDNDKVVDLDRKINGYLEDGVRLIWVVNPELRTVTIYTYKSKQVMILDEQDTLTGGTVLPDFEIPVSQIFALV